MKSAESQRVGSIARIGRIGLIVIGILGPATFAAPAPTPATPNSTAAVPLPTPGALGQNLDYLRVHDVPAGLVAAQPTANGALVLDLRFATLSTNDGGSLSGWLGTHARPNAPVLVLFNAATPPALLDALAPGYLPAGVITLAPAGTSRAADIAVEVDPATDRRAYEAFDQGTTLDALIATATEKQRFDESELIRRDAEAANGKSSPASTPPPPRSRGPAAPPSVTDPLLQRAVQLHRALLALGRLK